MSFHRIRILFFAAALFSLLLSADGPAPSSAAAMEPMDEAEMDAVQARSGIAFAAGNVRIYKHKGSLAYEDSSGNGGRLELTGMSYTDGNGGPMRFHSPQPITVHLFQSEDGRAVAGLSAPEWEQDFYVDAESVFFMEENMGSAHVHGLEPKEFALYATPLNEGGGAGIGFQLETRTDLEDLRWVYNDEGDFFSAAGTRVAGHFDSEGDDPLDPDTWQPKGRFQIGDLDIDGENGSFRPAEFRVVADAEDRAFVRLDMPEISGSIRVADIEMGGHELGPMIIDGIDVHELRVDFVPFEQ